MLFALGIPSDGKATPTVKAASQPPSLREAMKELEEAIEGETPEIKVSYSWWLKTWARLIKARRTFDARFRPKLEPGDIASVDFGWNVGHELSGRHWAVVLGVEDDKRSPILIVIPLSSEKWVDGRPREKRGYEQDLGYVIPQTEEEVQRAGRTGPVRSIARLDQMRAVSKQRIDYRRVHELPQDQWKLLNRRVFSMLFGDWAMFGEAVGEVAAASEKAQEPLSEPTVEVDRDTRTS